MLSPLAGLSTIIPFYIKSQISQKLRIIPFRSIFSGPYSRFRHAGDYSVSLPNESGLAAIMCHVADKGNPKMGLKPPAHLKPIPPIIKVLA